MLTLMNIYLCCFLSQYTLSYFRNNNLYLLTFLFHIQQNLLLFTLLQLCSLIYFLDMQYNTSACLVTLVMPDTGLRDPGFGEDEDEDDEDDEDVVRESAQTFQVGAGALMDFMFASDSNSIRDFYSELVFQDYKPTKLKIGSPHSDPIVESVSLSAAEPPDIHYKLHIDDAIEHGCLSSLQLEAICYACQRHEQFLPDKQRCGFFIGDGAGVGKVGWMIQSFASWIECAVFLFLS